MTVNIKQERDVWVAMTNTDLTEGRGHQIVYAVAVSPEAAARLGAGCYVQGTDCPVSKCKAFLIDGRWHAPAVIHDEIPLDTQHRLTREAREAKAKELESVISRAKDLGMSDADIDLLTKAKEAAQ